jgi:hypothetical protein
MDTLVTLKSLAMHLKKEPLIGDSQEELKLSE